MFSSTRRARSRRCRHLYWIGSIKQLRAISRPRKAAYAQDRAHPAAGPPSGVQNSPADFRVLALFAPFAGNTPHGYLFKDPHHYDTDTLALFELQPIRRRFPLKQDVQVVVNLISDADQAAAVLPLAADLGYSARQADREPTRATSSARREMPSRTGWKEYRAALSRRCCGRRQATDLAVLAPCGRRSPSSSAVLVRPARNHGDDGLERSKKPS